MLNFMNASENDKEIKTPTLKIRGKTMIFDDSVYYIPNISAVDIGQAPRRFLKNGLLLLFIGSLGMVFDYSPYYGFRFGIIGIVGGLIALTGLFLLYSWWNDSRYGLQIITNSGVRAILVTDDIEFIKKVALVLHNIMNDEQDHSLNISIDQRKIVEIGNASGTNLVVGDVKGDLVNSV